MLFDFHLEHAEGTFDVSTLPIDVIAWERKTKGKMANLRDNLGMEDLAFMAWSAVKRNGDTTEPFDKWVEGLQVLEPRANSTRPTSGDS